MVFIIIVALTVEDVSTLVLDPKSQLYFQVLYFYNLFVSAVKEILSVKRGGDI